MIPASAITPFAQTGPRRSAGADAARHRQQLRLAAAPRRTSTTSSTSRSITSSAPSMTAFGALQPPQARQLRAVADPRRDRQPEQRLRARAEQAVRRRLHLHAHSDLAARVPARLVAHRGRQGASRRRRSDHARSVRHHRAADRPALRRRADRAGRHRLDDVGAAEQQPAVPGSVRVQPAHQLLVGDGAARASRPATSTRRSTRRSTTSTRSTAATPTPASSAARPAPPRIPRPTTSPTSCSARATRYALINPFLANLRQRMHFGYLQDDFKASDRLTLNLGLRYEFATPQWEKDNFLTNFDPATNTLIQAKDGSIYDRALVNPDRNNFAPRLGLAFSDRRPDRAARRLRHELHPLQPARRREPALVQRPARRRPQHHAADVAAAVRRQPRRRRPASGRRSRAIRRAQHPGELQHR